MKKQFLWTLLLFSCLSNPDKNIPTESAVIIDSAKTITIDNKVSNSQKNIKHFDNYLPFEILSIKNTLNKNTTDTDTSICNTWTLSKKDISQIIKNSEPINGTIWDLSFLVLTCTKSVKILQSGQQYDAEINAGSFFSVSSGDTTLLFGDYKKSDRKYFIEGPNEE